MPNMKNFGRLIYDLNTKRGHDNEDRLIRIVCERKIRWPSWFHDIYRGLLSQEGLGIDAVVKTDVGKIFVQIKSSRAYAAKFSNLQRRRRYDQHIAIVVVNLNMNNEDIFQKLIYFVSEKRNKFLKERQERWLEVGYIPDEEIDDPVLISIRMRYNSLIAQTPH